MGRSDVHDNLHAAVGLMPLPTDPTRLARFVRWAQKEHILGQVAAVVDACDNERLVGILENASLRSGYDKRMLAFETDRIERALMGQGLRPVLLKGSAYVAEDLLAGIGRRVSDIDILVDEDELSGVEQLLKQAGWRDEAATANRYDQAYYRDWMHELPPLRHTTRRTLIDVHHRLLPKTARLQPDHKAMLADAVPIDGGNLRVFSPIDRFIHSAIHIFADGAFETPARSIMELYYLYNDLSVEDQGRLTARAETVRAGPPVAIALWALENYFGATCSAEKFKFSRMLKVSLKSLIENEKSPVWAKTFLYIRSHYMRMPLALLLKHLLKKALRRA